jgi:hypothetical protein
MNSRAKGCRGEREWRDFLRSYNLTARRGQQFAGGTESPDVICEELVTVHFEVKRVQSGNPYLWLEQAIRDAGSAKTPVVAHKRNNKDWICVVRAADLVPLLINARRQGQST